MSTDRPFEPLKSTMDLAELDVHLAARQSGEETPEQAARLDAWLAADPARRRVAGVLQHGTRSGQPVLVDLERGWTQVQSTLDEKNISPMLRQRRMTWRSFSLGLALAIVMVAAGVLSNIWLRASDAAARTYTTHVGERATVTLADGSHLTLAPSTTVTIDPAFGAKTRTITLVGQAYFDVAASGRAPFLVRTATLTTRVLGTAFDVRRYPRDRETQVVVVTGKVATQGGRWRTPATLIAGMIGRFTDSSATIVNGSDARAYTAWTNGQLIFTNARVDDMLAALRPWCGCELRLVGHDSATLAGQHVSAVFDVTERTETMRLLRRLLGVKMTVNGSVITLQLDETHDTPARMTIPQRTHSLSEVGR